MTSPFSITPDLSFALALRGTPGAYALLLGSGLSRSAGVPTGWDIVLDLTRRVAAAEGALDQAGADPEAWYRERFREEPSYTRLLEMLAAAPAERRELLRPYFEPNEEERSEGRKLPTRAHQAIAQLVARGSIRVIVTTNFDRLLEVALQDVGVAPAVISTADAVTGALPLQHERVTVVKLHGDYLDTRIRNTPEELAQYDAATDRLLDKVFDEYGLVVCGWSAAWDTALLAALERCTTRRFTTYWTHVGPLSPEAQRLIGLRRAQVVSIESADTFFQAVAHKVAALAEIERPHPISKAVSIASLKRYLPVEESRIRLHDLVMAEVELVRDRAAALLRPAGREWQELADVVPKLEGAAETMMALVALGAYWGRPPHMPLWRKALERLATIPVDSSLTAWCDAARYPAQLAFYAAGLAFTTLGYDDLLASWLKEPRIPAPGREDSAPVTVLHQYAVIADEAAKCLPGLERQKTPMSDHLHEVLRPVFAELVPEDDVFSDLFDRFEYLTALAYPGRKVEIAGLDADVSAWAPIGRFCWRGRRSRAGAIAIVGAEIQREGANWFLLRHGFYKGSLDELMAMKAEVDQFASRRGF